MRDWRKGAKLRVPPTASGSGSSPSFQSSLVTGISSLDTTSARLDFEKFPSFQPRANFPYSSPLSSPSSRSTCTPLASSHHHRLSQSFNIQSSTLHRVPSANGRGGEEEVRAGPASMNEPRSDDDEESWEDLEDSQVSIEPYTSDDEADEEEEEEEGVLTRIENLRIPPPRSDSLNPGHLSTSTSGSGREHWRLDSGSTGSEARGEEFGRDDVLTRSGISPNEMGSIRTSESIESSRGGTSGTGGERTTDREDSVEEAREGNARYENRTSSRERHRLLAERNLEGVRNSSTTTVDPLTASTSAAFSTNPMISESASTPPGSPELRNPRSRPSTEATTPNQTNGPFVSIANGPLAKLAANHSQSSKPTSRPQSFLSNLFNRSPSLGTSSSGQFANPSPRSPALNTIQSSDARHNRTQSLPPSPVLPQTSRASTDSATRDSSATTTRTSPRLSRTFAGLGRSVSLRTSPDRPTPPSLPLPPQSSKPAKVDNAPNSLDEMGLSLVTNTPQLRHSQQPLCGCVLDDKYLLIGTSNGLDFLPLPLPGSLPIHQLGKKKRKEIRKPISLIKRTRFRELVVLSERSNVLLAIAGRTDQVRVYALDGVRALIEKKMTELDIQDGYPWIQDSAVLYHDSISSSQKQSDKGKGKAPSRSRTTSTATSFDPPPPDYVPAAESSSSSSNPRRRPPPLHLAPTSSTSFPHPPPSVSPSTLTFSRRGSLANGAIVREVPTPSTSRTIRPQASREFSAGRKGSKATVQRRKSSVALSPSTTVPGGGGPTVVRPVHRQQKLLPRPEGRVGTSDLADFLRESGPDEDRENTNNNVRPVASGSRYVTPGEVSPRTNGLASSVAGPSTPRNRKRWTIDGTNSSLPNPVHSAVPEPLQPSTNIDRPRRISATEAPRRVHERSGHAGGGIDSKHAFRRGSEFDNFLPSLPPSSFSQEPRDQFSDNNSPLEYVKLARSRGSRLFRAVETKRRTYLAVLCGDEGERIELFTGSRSVSLSLNRTFVLPETPRSIDFQLQGDDLVDIYLIYDQSIFALEPSTIRVREVGVGRRSRGGGGDRNRERRTPATPIEENSGLERALDPTESPRRETRPVNLEVDDSRAPSPTTALPTRASSPSPETRSIQDPPSPSPRRIIRPEPRSTAQSVGPRTASTRKQPPYTTFTQLESIPPLPSGILSSQWTIPPLYQDVVAGSSTAPSPLVSDEPPLLSPVSLLRGAAMRNNGRPGLFYVSRGNALTGIVTADGKSIIKKPICWSSDPTRSPTDDSLQHIETLVVGGKKTVVVKLSNSEVKAISLEEGTSIPTLVASSTSLQLGIQFLSTHSAGQQTFFAQSTGTSSWVVKCLAARNS